MRKPILLILLFVVLLVAPTAVRYTQFYGFSGVDRPQPPEYTPDTIAAVPTPAASSFVDAPVAQTAQGLVLLDQAHRNQFTLNDLSYLDGRLAARGFDLLPYTGGDLSRQLRSVSAFITITPLETFTDEEIQAIRRFAAQGGRVLLVGDPTRYEVLFDEEDPFAFSFELAMDKTPLNSLANEFDLIYNGDYLYNTVENEGNFRNIILRLAEAGEGLTEDVTTLAFYGSHSLQVGADARPLLTADDNTWSSATDRPGGLVLAATSRDGQVLALGDVHFLTEPYYTVYDNGRFIAHIADFLTTNPERDLVLADFPYFYRQPVNLIYAGDPELGAGAFDEIIALQEAFDRIDMPLTLANAPQPDHDALYLGLYNQAEEVADILASVGVTLTIQPPIVPAEPTDSEPAADTADVAEDETDPTDETAAEDETAVRLIQSELGNVQMSGTALVVVDESNGRRTLIVLAASSDGLENVVNGLLTLIPRDAEEALAACLLQDPLALCPTGLQDEEVEAELMTTQFNGSGVSSEPTPPSGGGDPIDDLNANLKGAISIGDTVEGTLGEQEAHAWEFSDGPAVIDIALTSDDEMDGVLELYDADNQLLQRQDSTFAGETEEFFGVTIDDDATYTIVVRDFFEDGGSYTLSVREGGSAEEGAVPTSEDIFLFVEDDGEPLNGGVTSAAALEALLTPEYTVTVWTASADGPLEDDVLDGYGLVIWDTGDYQNADGFLDEDLMVILSYLENGGSLFYTGSAPSLFGELELGALSDVEIIDSDPILTNDLTPGDIFALDQTYEAVISDQIGDTFDEASPAFLLRGPESDTPGAIAGFGVHEESLNQHTIFVMFPFVALPIEVQATLLENIMTWFGM